MIQIAVIGCGWAGRHHAEAIMSKGVDDRLRIVSAADADSSKLAECGRLWGLADDRLYTDYRTMLQRDDIDAVSVCLPTNLHHESGLAVLESGRHLLMEKPMTVTVAEGRELVEAADSAERLLMVAESAVFQWSVREAARMIRDGLIGRPLLARSSLLVKNRGEDLGGRPWLLDADQAGGGMFMTNGIHAAAVMRRLLGEVNSVFARRVHPTDDLHNAIDTIVASMGFESGCIGEIAMSMNIDRYELPSRYTIHGTDGTILAPRGRRLSRGFRVWAERFDNQSREIINPRPEWTPFQAELSHFADCILQDRKPETSGRDQLRSLAIIEAGYRSIETGRPETPAA
ncbi:MAG: Gfo/Idh/MocA family oxidoreductase [Planctomycetes bacterium]|nr:Gfo/Idh/MocA family oxidoreductase [Planctomycetota bacterium]